MLEWQAIFALGSAAIGSTCHVFWPNAGSWFAARVAEVQPAVKSIVIQYDDGRHDTLELSKEDQFFKVKWNRATAWLGAYWNRGNNLLLSYGRMQPSLLEGGLHSVCLRSVFNLTVMEGIVCGGGAMIRDSLRSVPCPKSIPPADYAKGLGSKGLVSKKYNALGLASRVADPFAEPCSNFDSL